MGRAAGARRPAPAAPGRLSHVRGAGARAVAAMVDVSAKNATPRSALARATLVFPRGLLARVLRGQGPKGPIGEVARLAGVLAAKRTGELIPLCHSLGLDHVEVELQRRGALRLEVRCRAKTIARTGVEMEALVGAALAALAVYDMTKALSKEIAVERLELVEKSGGKSGGWRRR